MIGPAGYEQRRPDGSVPCSGWSVTGDELCNLRYGTTKAGSALSAEAWRVASVVASDIKDRTYKRKTARNPSSNRSMSAGVLYA